MYIANMVYCAGLLCRYPWPAMQPLVIYHVYVNSGEFAGSEMYVKLSAMYIALVFWPIDECILLLPAATYVAGPAAGGPDHRWEKLVGATLQRHRKLYTGR